MSTAVWKDDGVDCSLVHASAYTLMFIHFMFFTMWMIDPKFMPVTTCWLLNAFIALAVSASYYILYKKSGKKIAMVASIAWILAFLANMVPYQIKQF